MLRENHLQHLLTSEHWEQGVESLLLCLNPWLQAQYRTILVAAVSEPYYQPATGTEPVHQIHFAHGYFSSALHELAHWCVAGEQRRLLPDYGYWYEPDGRTADQQQEFERVEVCPQAIEWHLAAAAGRRFRVSIDNLSGTATDPTPFKQSVAKRAFELKQNGLPERAQALVALLRQQFDPVSPLFDIRELD